MFLKHLSKVNLGIFVPSVIISVIAIICMITIPEQAKVVIDAMFAYLTNDLGWLYLITVFVTLIFGLWLSFSKYGSIKMGAKDEKKEYSTISWIAMMFTAGIGVGVVVMAFIEPLSYLQAPPFNIAPMSDEAYVYAHMYGQFHYGISAWLVYAPTTVAVAYMLYVKKEPVLKMSRALKAVLGKHTEGIIGKIIDIIVMLGIIGGIATSLGMGIPMVSRLVHSMFGIPEGTGLTLGILFVWFIIFGSSVFLGLDKGIKRLSDINLLLVLLLLVFVLFKIPTSFLLNLQTNSLGLLIDKFIPMSLSTDPITKGGFPQAWTIFYWAWWLGFMPMMALFVARISRGRTIKEILLGEVIYGGGGCMLFFATFGGYAIYLQQSGKLDLVNILQTQGREEAIIQILHTLPMAGIITFIYLVLVFVFLATSIDSSAYVLSSVCTNHLSGEEQPSKIHRLLWAAILMLFALGLVLIGGLQTIQTASIVVGLPLVAVTFIAIIAVSRLFKGHEDINDFYEEESKE